MKIAYFSPFSPMPSGISDFSEELILKLKDYMEIDVFSKNIPENREINENFNVYRFSEIEKYQFFPNKYDHLVYHMGNNIMYHKEISDIFMKYSGILELHDLSLHHFLAEDTYMRGDGEAYIAKMKYCHGEEGEKAARDFLDNKIRAPWETDSDKYSVNKHYIDYAKAVIVHSDMAKQMVKGIRKDVPIINIPLHATEIFEKHEEEKLKSREKLGISSDKIIFGSFGYATSAKRIYQILEALSIIRKTTNIDFHYYIIGKVEGLDIDAKLKQLNMLDKVTCKGFISLDIFKEYMAATDICFNLRYPTQGESSATLNRLLGMGKVVFVTDIGSFAEYPSDLVCKIRYDSHEIDDIVEKIKNITKNKDYIHEKSNFAVKYSRENFDIEKNAQKYFCFFEELLSGKWREEYIDNLIDNLFTFKNLNRDYFNHIAEKIDFMRI